MTYTLKVESVDEGTRLKESCPSWLGQVSVDVNPHVYLLTWLGDRFLRASLCIVLTPLSFAL